MGLRAVQPAIFGLAALSFLGSLGLVHVVWRAGFWTCLASFVAATTVSYLAHRAISRSPPAPSG